jgi:hypothetical protein
MNPFLPDNGNARVLCTYYDYVRPAAGYLGLRVVNRVALRLMKNKPHSIPIFDLHSPLQCFSARGYARSGKTRLPERTAPETKVASFEPNLQATPPVDREPAIWANVGDKPTGADENRTPVTPSEIDAVITG